MASARTTAAMPPRQRRATARSAGRRRATHRTPLRIRWERVGRVVLLVVLAVVLGLYVQQGLAYLSVRSQANHQAALVNRLSHENAQLVRQERALNNPTTIVQDARKLGMVNPGERPYVISGLPSG